MADGYIDIIFLLPIFGAWAILCNYMSVVCGSGEQGKHIVVLMLKDSTVSYTQF
jgi:hypothetical protein